MLQIYLFSIFNPCLRSKPNSNQTLHVHDDNTLIENKRVTHYNFERPTPNNRILPLDKYGAVTHDELYQQNKIHSNIHATGTKWTRQTTSDPNQQNFDKRLQFLFGPRPGYIWMYSDVVNIELRIWAYEVGAKDLIKRFEAGESVHIIIAKILYPELINRLGISAFKNSKTYTDCKSGTFSRIYGSGVAKCNSTYGVPNACAVIDQMCPEIGEYFKQLSSTIQLNYEEFGYPCIFTRQGYKLDVPVTKLYSVPSARIQGTAALIVQEIQVELMNFPLFKNPLQLPLPSSPENMTLGQRSIWNATLGIPDTLRCQQIQQVHDSINIEMPSHPNEEETCRQLLQFMEKVACRTIPTCPLDYEIIVCHQDEEPLFKDYLFIPEKIEGYDIEMFIHNHQYLCVATYSEDLQIKEYGATRKEAYNNIVCAIEGTPF